VNRSIIIAIIIALAVIAWIASGQMGGNESGEQIADNSGTPPSGSAEQSANKTTMAVRYLTFTARPRQQNIIVHGKTEANRIVEVKAEVAGRVQKIHVSVGDRVKTGDPIVSFDVKDNGRGSCPPARNRIQCGKKAQSERLQLRYDPRQRPGSA
jgi:multidrug efflux pump subunit AcrA (membrane-fusion protein)